MLRVRQTDYVSSLLVRNLMPLCVCVCVCVCEIEREGEKRDKIGLKYDANSHNDCLEFKYLLLLTTSQDCGSNKIDINVHEQSHIQLR